jgi:hypothetical protein
MKDELTLAKDIATIAAPFTAAIVETWIKPKLQALIIGQRQRRALMEIDLSGRFDEYLKRAYERQSYLTTVVFQNQKQLLKELYLPLTVQMVGRSARIKIDSYTDDLLPKHKRVLLTDTAGMGKSTLLRFLFLECIEQNSGIPIFIELRHLTAERSIIDVICEELDSVDESVDREVIVSLLARGDFVFFLDGYDEIPVDERMVVTRTLQNFISKARNNLFVLSSRPETALATFADFQQFTIRPLELREAFRLIKLYAKQAPVGDALIARLQGDTLRQVHEFLANPFLVSLLYKSYEYKPTVPLKKHIFYRQVYDALFETHDLSKGDAYIREKYSKLDIDDFHRVLRVLGFTTFTAGKLEYDRDEILTQIAKARARCPGLDFKAADFLTDLVKTVPLFNVDGTEIRWSHKSIQEYFAAQFICLDSGEKRNNLLTRMTESMDRERYQNILDLCYDIDYKTFRHVVLVALAKDFLAYWSEFKQLPLPENTRNEDWIELGTQLFGRAFVTYSRESIGPEMKRIERVIKNGRLEGMFGNGGILVDVFPSTNQCTTLYGEYPYGTLVRFLAGKQDALVSSVGVSSKEGSKSALARAESIMRAENKPIVASDVRHGSFEPLDVGACLAICRYLSVSRTVLTVDRCREFLREIEEELRQDLELDKLTDLL